MRIFLIKKYYFLAIFFLLLNSCGIIGREKVVPNENAVLSGPPLTIPPDFDIQQSENNDLGAPLPIDIVDQEVNENFANIPSLEQETPYSLEDSLETIETLNSTNIQNFETYDSNKTQAFVPRQIENNQVKLLRKKMKVSVPSDVYDVNMTRSNYINKQKRKSYFESENNVFTNRFEIENNQNLSKDEENLLEEIIIEDFETRGDLD